MIRHPDLEYSNIPRRVSQVIGRPETAALAREGWMAGRGLDSGKTQILETRLEDGGQDIIPPGLVGKEGTEGKQTQLLLSAEIIRAVDSTGTGEN